MVVRLTFASRDVRKNHGLQWHVAWQRKSRHDGASPDWNPPVSTAVYTANVLTSARMAAGMTSRARRPLDEHPAG